MNEPNTSDCCRAIATFRSSVNGKALTQPEAEKKTHACGAAYFPPRIDFLVAV
jgi:hypothetical protein